MAEVADNPALNRYELVVDGVTAFVEYRRTGGVIELTHTEVPKALSGRGIGTALARGTLDRIRDEGLTVRPLCPFIAAFIERHPDTADLVAADRG
ncbi:GNAT family N-acetyltransferase [Inquilinus limosus]|uniref:GNAT family N-acetyltransferase n=1 Tax=Inquilinus limosus TaxID=171674 RepID=UPI000408A0FD|nr:GNAT family N-acetyltransferase [Inquilinus limosus]